MNIKNSVLNLFRTAKTSRPVAVESKSKTAESGNHMSNKLSGISNGIASRERIGRVHTRLSILPQKSDPFTAPSATKAAESGSPEKIKYCCDLIDKIINVRHQGQMASDPRVKDAAIQLENALKRALNTQLKQNIS
ncbi:hypothetical protein [Yersinia proxima]|uniref:hypothetical protein n=1 Tax=Yersinia proxima TaxID=2890316 RepID=UPI001D1057AF|nr:hypothetical protein [Yersinia proxima]